MTATVIEPRTSRQKRRAMVGLQHTRSDLSRNQCSSFVNHTIDAPLPLVWSLVHRFNNPQAYKQFIRTCTMVCGTGDTGSVRDVTVVSGLPAHCSHERLDELDDEKHLMTFSIIRGDHRLRKYRSTISLHHEEEEDDEGGSRKTAVIESYAVDVPGRG